MSADEELPLSQRRSSDAFSSVQLNPAVNDVQLASQYPQPTTVPTQRKPRRPGHVPVYPVSVNQAPEDQPEPSAAECDYAEDSQIEADKERNNSLSEPSSDDEESPQGYQSRFREHFDISAAPEDFPWVAAREIPDSQEDPADLNLSGIDEDSSDSQEDPPTTEARGNEYPSDQEDLINAFNDFLDAQENPSQAEDARDTPGGFKYTLHAGGINCNGRLPIEDPRFADDDDEMEEHPTQSTQPFVDPRRLGSKPVVNDLDESDLVCVLHPTSPAAYKAVELVAQATPQHILQNNDLSHILEEVDKLPEQGTMQGNALSGLSQTDGADDPPLAATGSTAAQDIALRFSSRVNDVCLGWTFGRSARKSDVLICDNSQAILISSMHFRIYLKDSGSLMLEDTSMNGTMVDTTSLSKTDYEQEDPAIPPDKRTRVRWMIQTGSEIRIMTVEDPKDGIRFLVSVPVRTERWWAKLNEYLGYVAQVRRQREAIGEAGVDGNGLIIPPTVARNIQGNAQREGTLSANALRAFAAGTERSSHGMVWKGDDKYNVVEYIGKGAFANVYKIATKHDGEAFAAKELEKRRFVKDGVLDQKLHNELLIMKGLCHPNIVKYVDYKEIPKYLYIIMEYVPNGDLMTFFNSGTVMPEYMGQLTAQQICSALDYLHKRNITHRDIKPDNILIASTDPFEVKLSDFGLSKAIADKETLLKTFCGTLLYCAPEVYPDYERFKAGKRGKRGRHEPPSKTSPYQQSVDIWAFAAVLYHLLCGTPAWTGIFDYNGAQMLETVMTVPVDWDRLRHAGISREAIDFLRGMLVLDPALRSTDAECLRHPWIMKAAGSWDDIDVDMNIGAEDLLAISEDEGEQLEAPIEGHLAIRDNHEDDLDASQLSLNDKPADQEIQDSDGDYLSDVDELPDTRESKRFKARHVAHGESSSDVTYPYLPGVQGVQLHTESIRPTANRLFGEIGASALRSSGVLGYDAHAALQMPMDGNRDGGASASDIHYTTDDSVTSDGLAQHPLQYPRALPAPNFTGSAPSLFGTEALVNQLNMASPESAVSGPSASTSAAPTTPKTREPSPLSTLPAGSKRSTQEMSSQSEETTPKRAKSNISESPSHPSVEPSIQQSVSKSPSNKNAGKYKTSGGKTSTSPSKSRDAKASNDTNVEKAKDKQPEKESKHAGVLTDVPKTEHRQGSNQGSSSSKHSASTPAAEEGTGFTKPRARLGNLTPIPGSIFTPTIKLEKRMTTYGRDPGSDYQHKEGRDARIPKCALDIVFWRPGIEAQLAENPELDWTTFDDIYAIVATRTSQAIQVNGVLLRKGDGRWNFGKLHTGDIITIFPAIGKEGKEAEFLKFKCEFLVGASKEPRKEGSVFTVEKEEEKFLQMEARKSRESSEAATSTTSHTAASATAPAAAP